MTHHAHWRDVSPGHFASKHTDTDTCLTVTAASVDRGDVYDRLHAVWTRTIRRQPGGVVVRRTGRTAGGELFSHQVAHQFCAKHHGN